MFSEYEDNFVQSDDSVNVVHSSTKALLVSIDGVDDHVWIPLSQIHDDSEVFEKGTEGTLIISKWLAVKKGLVSE